MIKANRFPVLIQTDDLYSSHLADEILSIRTFYEQQWLDRGLNIKYIRFVCAPREIYIEPEVKIEPDNYRSFNRFNS
jgi:tRNA (guanine-N7-)-methyltransferase